LYLCLSSIWGAAGGDLLNPHYSWDHYGDQNKRTGPQDLKKAEGLPFKQIPTRNTSAGAVSSGALLRGLAATSEAAVEISAKGREW
jgi:hypothetical protein